MVDLKKNESVMKEAWKEVTSPASDVDWALFGYEGQTNVLTLISKGDDGIDGMTEDLNPSKILYGFMKVDDPKTSLPKYVLLNWQGETAPGNRKGMCAMHLRDVERFLSGHHLTVNLRNEEDIDMDSIIKKVSEITGSAYNFKAKPQGMEHSPEPVGTAHRKINPLQELPKMAEREKFWSRDQIEEKQRILEERERRTTESRRTEEERVSREEREKNLRENQIKEREKKVSLLRDQEKLSLLERDKDERSQWERQQEEDALEARERSQRSEKMRQERAKEAKELIQNRPGDAKKLFTRNSSQGQMNLPRALPPSNGTRNGISAGVVVPAPSAGVLQQEPRVGETQPNPDKSNVESVQGSQPAATEESGQSLVREADQHNIAPPPPGFQQQEESEGSAGEEVDLVAGGHLHHATPLNLNQEDEGSLQSYGVCAVSLYDYQASDETEITFDPGQIITHIDQIDPGWWQGLGPDGSYGLFPANYVEIIDSSELQIQS